MIDVSGSYTLGGKTNRGLASQVAQNTRDIQYLLNNGLLPEGDLEITENGEYDVKQKASVTVSVPIGIFPSGTKIITANGSYDVENFASVLINVSGGVEPVGTKNITANGDYDVKLYETAHVAVPTPNFNEPVNIYFGVQAYLYYRKVEDGSISFAYELTYGNETKSIRICSSQVDPVYGTIYLRDDVLILTPYTQEQLQLTNCTILSEEPTTTPFHLYRLALGNNPRIEPLGG